MKRFDDAWRAWTQRNLDEGCPKDILFKLLHDSGFGYEQIREVLNHEPTMSLDRIFSPLASLAPEVEASPPPLAQLLEPVPLPPPEPWMIEQLREQQQEVPLLGCGGASGYEQQRLDPEIFAEIAARFDTARADLQIEDVAAIGGYVGTVSRNLPPSLVALDMDFNRTLLDLLKPLHEEWCGFELVPSSCYGFRVYLDGAYLYEHVDRKESHVISSSLCVAQECYVPWPLAVERADGKWRHVEASPGDLFLYESARIAHGRPVPLHGTYYAALFLHYRPAEGWEVWKQSPQEWYDRFGP